MHKKRLSLDSNNEIKSTLNKNNKSKKALMVMPPTKKIVRSSSKLNTNRIMKKINTEFKMIKSPRRSVNITPSDSQKKFKSYFLNALNQKIAKTKVINQGNPLLGTLMTSLKQTQNIPTQRNNKGLKCDFKTLNQRRGSEGKLYNAIPLI